MNGSINGVVSPSTMTMEIVEGYQYMSTLGKQYTKGSFRIPFDFIRCESFSYQPFQQPSLFHFHT